MPGVYRAAAESGFFESVDFLPSNALVTSFIDNEDADVPEIITLETKIKSLETQLPMWSRDVLFVAVLVSRCALAMGWGGEGGRATLGG